MTSVKLAETSRLYMVAAAQPGLARVARRFRFWYRISLHVPGVDELQGADDPEGQLVVDGQVGPQDLGILEVLVDQVDLAGEADAAGGLVQGIGHEGEGRVADVEAGELHAGVGELVGDPDVGRPAGEEADAAADLGGLVVEHVPVEAEAGREHEVARGRLVGLDAVDLVDQRVGGRRCC